MIQISISKQIYSKFENKTFNMICIRHDMVTQTSDCYQYGKMTLTVKYRTNLLTSVKN